MLLQLVVQLLFLKLLQSASGSAVSVIDISALLEEQLKRETSFSALQERSQAYRQAIELVDDALQTHGSFLAVGLELAMPARRCQQALQSARQLFCQSQNSLDAVKVQKAGLMRGYIAYGAESGVANRYFEAKEGYSYGFDWSSGERSDCPLQNSLQGLNIWPQDVDSSIVGSLDSLFVDMNLVARAIASAVLEEAFPHNKTIANILSCGDTISVMRLFHYITALPDGTSIADAKARDYCDASRPGRIDETEPPARAATASQSPRSEIGGKSVLGSSPHTDWGFLTLILQDQAGGLQFLHEHRRHHAADDDDGAEHAASTDSEWVDVPVVQHSLVINGGDYLSLLSGGRYHSPIHRVLSPLHERYSFVLFYYPNFESTIPFAETSSSTAKTSTAASSASASALASASASQLEYNTLLDVDVDAAMQIDRSGPSHGYAFGDYIIAKWKGVFSSN